MRLAKVLKEYMWAKKLSLRDMAPVLGFSVASLSRFLNGKNLDAKHLASILKWLLAEDDELET